jgi:hypothetical protein
MRNKLICIIGFLIILAVGIVLIFTVDDKNGEKYVKDHDYLYDLAINYLIDQDDEQQTPDHEKEGYHYFVTYDPFGITVKDDTYYVYMWVLDESYYLDKGEIESGASSSVFNKFTFKDDKVVKYETPKDGGDYTDSIKDMCPDSKMSNKALNYDLKLSLDDEVQKYYQDNKYTFTGVVLENQGNETILVKVLTPDNYYFKKNSKVLVHTDKKIDLVYAKDMELSISYGGIVLESYPPQITAGTIGIVKR